MGHPAAHDPGSGQWRARLTRRALLRVLGGGAGLAAARPFLDIANTVASPAAGLLVVGASFVIKSLDPGRTIESTTEMINHSTYDSLVTFEGEDLKIPRPSLATDWKVSSNGRAYTFTLSRMGDEAEPETNPGKRVALLQRVQRTLVEIGPFIPLFQPAIPLAFRSNIHSAMFHSVWGLDFYPITKA